MRCRYNENDEIYRRNPMKKNYPLHPQTEATPLYTTVQTIEYETIKRKLDTAQKECIRIAELYKKDRKKFEAEMDRLAAMIDNAKA